MSERSHLSAPDYTRPALVFMFINMLWIFGVIWAHWGLAPVVLLALVLNHLIERQQHRRARRN